MQTPHFHLTRLALLAGLAACSRPAPVATVPEPRPLAVKHNDTAAIARARADSARIPYVKADVDFMQGMISHHAQAIVMSKWAPDRGASDPIRRLTSRIINAQTDEIIIMQQWLADREQMVPEADARGMKMSHDGMEHMMLMPGMLSEEQMKQLEAARGAEFDRLFLVFMIQHHKGAVDMVDKLFATQGAGQENLVFKFASDVHTDQSTEIARMQLMLDGMNPKPE